MEASERANGTKEEGTHTLTGGSCWRLSGSLIRPFAHSLTHTLSQTYAHTREGTNERMNEEASERTNDGRKRKIPSALP